MIRIERSGQIRTGELEHALEHAVEALVPAVLFPPRLLARRARAGRHSRMSQRARRPHVHKFGGASLADATAVRHAVALIVRHRAEPTRGGALGDGGRDGRAARHCEARGASATSRRRCASRRGCAHGTSTSARAVLRGARQRAEVVRAMDESFAELDTLVRGLDAVRELTPRTTDLIVARGERLSATLVAARAARGAREGALRGRDARHPHRRCRSAARRPISRPPIAPRAR